MTKRICFAILFGVALVLGVSTQAIAQNSDQQSDSQQQASQQQGQQQTPASDSRSGADQVAGGNEKTSTQSQKAQGQQGTFITRQASSQILTSSIMGITIQNSAGKDAQQIGTVNDLIMNKQHQLVGVVVGVGGFLGIGEKSVGIPLDAVENIDAQKGIAVVTVSKEQLQQAPSFTTKQEQQQEKKQKRMKKEMRQRQLGQQQMLPQKQIKLQREQMLQHQQMLQKQDQQQQSASGSRSGDEAAGDSGEASVQNQKAQGQLGTFITRQKSSQILASFIMGMTIQNSADKDAQQIGTINDLIMNKQHQLVGVVVGVGGFLGIGEKSVGIPLHAVENIDAQKGIAVVAVSKKQLQQAPSFTTKQEQQQELQQQQQTSP